MKGFGVDKYSGKKDIKKIKRDYLKAKLLDDAFNYHSKGNLSDAANLYQEFLENGFLDSRVLSNYGAICRTNGNIELAISLLKKSIKLYPNKHEAYVNLGNILNDQGKAYEAEKYFRLAISLNPESVQSYSNLGNILKDLGKLSEAETLLRHAIKIQEDFIPSYINLITILLINKNFCDAEIFLNKAIEIAPNLSDVYNILGGFCIKLGLLEKAESSIKKAIELNPNFAGAWNNLGNLYRIKGNLNNSEIYLRKSIQLNSEIAEPYSALSTLLMDRFDFKAAEIAILKVIDINNAYPKIYLKLADLLKNTGRYRESFDNYLKAINHNPKDYNVFYSLSRFLSDCPLALISKNSIHNILNILLDRDDIQHSRLFNAFNYLYSKDHFLIDNNLDYSNLNPKKLDSFVTDKLLSKALKKVIFRDLRWERTLTIIRRQFLNSSLVDSYSFSKSELDFVISLANQCFLNEYVYSNLDSEDQLVDHLINNLDSSSNITFELSIIACYRPLLSLVNTYPSIIFYFSDNYYFNQLMKLQLLEPMEERYLTRNIDSIGVIDDFISKVVREQYEQNPYPRWRYANTYLGVGNSVPLVINNEINPNFINAEVNEKSVNILIAGCGTGQQILQSQMFKNAEVTAIDLSLSSLSYAKRKMVEFGIKNVRFIKLDILDVSLLNQDFDIILCSGVLHHMSKPDLGLRSLLKVLKKGGFLKLGLYSELARQDIVKAKNYINENYLSADITNIRHFRNEILNDKCSQLNSLTKIYDFYTTSECRDLCFHAMEHRFTMHQLQDMLINNGLQFLGFFISNSIRSQYLNMFPNDSNLTNLANWTKFERQYPLTFRSMYQFWVLKNN